MDRTLAGSIAMAKLRWVSRSLILQCEIGGLVVPQNSKKIAGRKVSAAIPQFGSQPRSGVTPTAKGGCASDTKCLGGFLYRQTREKPKLHNVRGQGIFGRELVEGIVQLQQPVWLLAGDPVGGFQFNPPTPMAVFVGLL